MNLRIGIDMENSAFSEDSGTEVARILRELADNFDQRDLLPNEEGRVRDINGNTCGAWLVKT